MSEHHGRFIWYELITPDPEAAKRFYSQVVGWTTEDMTGGGMTYTVVSAGADGVGGIMEIPAEAKAMGAPPHWSGYVAVDDCDAAAEKIGSLGGQVIRAPDDIPNIGRFAVVADPQGAVFVLFKGAPTTPPLRPAPMSPGSLAWSELHAADWEKAFGFYASLFGWVKHDAVPMGEMGVYQTFGAPAAAFGGMFSGHAPAPGPYWLCYFGVDDVDAAVERTKAHGGEILMGPAEVPGGAWVVNAKDPQGALFAFLGPRG